MIASERKSKELGERGKDEEKRVSAYLTSLSCTYAGFEFGRIYDARSAGGKFPARAGDFEFFHRFGDDTWHGLIEVKALKHDCRLGKARLTTIPKLVKRQLAGGVIVVLVHHTETDLWRMPPFQFFVDRQDAPSWDMSAFKTYPTVKACLSEIRELR